MKTVVAHRFQKGNQAAKGNPGPRGKPMTQVLLSQLNEMDKNGGDRSNMHAIVEELITLAKGKVTVSYKGKGKNREKIVTKAPGDLTAILGIMDRVDGKPVQAMEIDGGVENTMNINVIRRVIVDVESSPSSKMIEGEVTKKSDAGTDR